MKATQPIMPDPRRPNYSVKLQSTKSTSSDRGNKGIVKSFIKIAKPDMDLKGFHHTQETFARQKRLNDPKIRDALLEKAMSASRRSRRSRVTQE